MALYNFVGIHQLAKTEKGDTTREDDSVQTPPLRGVAPSLRPLFYAEGPASAAIKDGSSGRVYKVGRRSTGAGRKGLQLGFLP